MSIKFKLTLQIVLLNICVAALLVAFLVFSERSGIINDPASRLSLRVQELAENYTRSGGTSGVPSGKSAGVYCALFSADGSTLSGFLPNKALGRESFVPDSIRIIETENRRYYLYDAPVDSSEDGLFIRGAINITDRSEWLSGMIRTIPFLLLITALLSLSAGWLLARRALLPVENVGSSAADILNSRKLSDRLRLRGSAELDKLALSFNGMLSRLERSSDEEKRFSSDVSHELRTPITVILAESEHALRRERSGEEYRESLTVIRKQGNYMKDMVDSLLAMTRMANSGDVYPLTEIDLSELVELSYEEALGWESEKHISISAEIIPGITVRANELLLLRAIKNLLQNAMVYGRENGFIKIGLYCSQDGKNAVISVEDNGIGIEEKDLNNIWLRFWRSDAGRSPESGSGLGLSMVREIAEFHKGTVHVISQPDAGSTFFILLPLSNTK